MSLPIRRARIENTGAHDAKGADYVAPHTGSENWKRNKSCKTKLDGSLPMRGARIEKAFWWIQTGRIRSLSMRGAWIEKILVIVSSTFDIIAPHAGSENWNSRRLCFSQQFIIAPHAGNENWNLQIKEDYIIFLISLPMQGARIEIDDDYKGMTFDIIAPYTGDENWNQMILTILAVRLNRSPRREARIEILSRENAVRAKYIASHAGDENWNLSTAFVTLVNQIALHAGSENWNKMLLRLQS